MPELPEVEALALDLGGRLDGRAIVTVHVPQFSALKTYRPPISALEGTLVDRVGRFGKFLDIEASGTHLVLHLARAGWVRWRDEVPAIPPKPSPKSTLALRIVLDDDGSGTSPGLDVTEAGTRKSLAAYVVRDPMDVPGIASLGPDPLTDDFTEEALGEILQREGRSTLEPEELTTLYAALRSTLGAAVDRSRGLAASELKGEKKSNLAVHGRTGQACPVCGDTVREVSFADSSLQYCPTCQTGGKPLADRRMSRLLK